MQNVCEPFTISVPDAVVDDLKARLRRTRWPADLNNDDWRYGVNTAHLRGLAEHWAERFDWRVVEAEMNRLEHFRVTIDNVRVHFVRAAGKGPSPKPLILTHGWPWTFWDMRRVIGPLSDPAAHGGDPRDAFDVIVPSLPGFGFSTPTRAGMNFWRTADLWRTLMVDVLGYKRFAAAGGDWGALVSGQLGHKYARDLYGVHLAHAIAPNLFHPERPWDITGGQLIPSDVAPDVREAMLTFQRRLVAHVAVQVLEPQTLAYGMHDSPVALLAWLFQRWRGWGHVMEGDESALPVDQMLANATLYWATETFVSSARFYADAAHDAWRPSHERTPMVETPTGITFLGGENPPPITTEQRVDAFRAGPRAAAFNLHFLNAHPTGGHFAHFENAPALIADIRATFRDLT